jgi:pimeloyl-ACP methyl ester carboxylesterase
MSAIIIDGKLLHYEAFGRGVPLIFVHGWLGSWRYWMPAMELMSEHSRTYAMDLWGYGDSDRANGQYSIEIYVKLLKDFIDEMGIGSVTLVGHALGAAVAMYYAAHHPEQMERIMAVSTPLIGRAINRKLLDPEPSFLDRVRGWNPSEGHAEVEQAMERMAENVMASNVRATMATDLRQIVGQLQIPVLLVHGEKDALVTPPQAEWLSMAGSNVRTMLLPEMQHFPMLGQTTQFTQLLTDFLSVQDATQLADLAIRDEWRRRTH